jgi:hypothetical protein
MENGKDTLSYALGVHYAQGYSTELMQKRYGIDASYMPKVIEGMIEVDQEDDVEDLASYAGISLVKNFELMIQEVNRTFFGDETKNKINEVRFFDTFFLAANGSDAGMVAEKAEQFLININNRILENDTVFSAETCDSLSVALAVACAQNFDLMLTEKMHIDPLFKGTIIASMKNTQKTTDIEQKAFHTGVAMGVQFANEILPRLQAEFFDNPSSFNKDNFYIYTPSKGNVSIFYNFELSFNNNNTIFVYIDN